MIKKEDKNNKNNSLNPLSNLLNTDNHPTITSKLTTGQKASDMLTKWMGSWFFIIIFIIVLVSWIWLNSFYLIKILNSQPFDPFPYILLNLALSCLAAIQAPIILMSQNREAQKDRIRAEYDYAVNRKAAREIDEVQKQLDRIERKINSKK